MKTELQKQIQEILRELGVENPKVVLDYPMHMEMGDSSTNVAMVYAKILSKNPVELAEEIKQKLVDLPGRQVLKVEVIRPGFINFFFTQEFFENVVRNPVKEKESEVFKGEKFFIEHTQPNPFKTFHIGHLMNNAIGESISRIVEANDAEVQIASYHGDKGLHVAKAVWAMKNGVSLKDSYAYGHKEYEENEKAKEEILEINKKIYDESDPEIMKIYEDGRQESLENFEAMYKKLDSHFDYHFFESESGEVGKELVKENEVRVFEKGEGGAIIFKGENFEPKTHTRVFLNSEGLPTYEAKELGLAQIKKDWFDYDKSITVTANEQDSFFKVVEVAIGEVFPELKGKLKHLSHGILKLPTGKMSSRTGSIISAEDLIEQVKDKVKEKMHSRILPKRSEGSDQSEGEAPTDKEVDTISEEVAIGAIKYSILRSGIGSDIVFDFDKSISFDGDSGPYLQYSAVRANSILKKAEGVVSILEKSPEGWKTTNLERLLERFGSVVEKAGKEYSPSHITTYLIELSSEFNRFYAENKIIDEEDKTSGYKLAITKAFVGVIAKGLSLLAIKVPEKM